MDLTWCAVFDWKDDCITNIDPKARKPRCSRLEFFCTTVLTGEVHYRTISYTPVLIVEMLYRRRFSVVICAKSNDHKELWMHLCSFLKNSYNTDLLGEFSVQWIDCGFKSYHDHHFFDEFESHRDYGFKSHRHHIPLILFHGIMFHKSLMELPYYTLKEISVLASKCGIIP